MVFITIFIDAQSDFNAFFFDPIYLSVSGVNDKVNVPID